MKISIIENESVVNQPLIFVISLSKNNLTSLKYKDVFEYDGYEFFVREVLKQEGDIVELSVFRRTPRNILEGLSEMSKNATSQSLNKK